MFLSNIRKPTSSFWAISKNALTSYLLTFDFRKEANKQRRAEWVDFDNGTRIFDVVL